MQYILLSFFSIWEMQLYINYFVFLTTITFSACLLIMKYSTMYVLSTKWTYKTYTLLHKIQMSQWYWIIAFVHYAFVDGIVKSTQWHPYHTTYVLSIVNRMPGPSSNPFHFRNIVIFKINLYFKRRWADARGASYINHTYFYLLKPTKIKSVIIFNLFNIFWTSFYKNQIKSTFYCEFVKWNKQSENIIKWLHSWLYLMNLPRLQV